MNPMLLKERAQSTRSGPESRVHRTAVGALLVVMLSQWAIAGLDARLRWLNALPPSVVAAGSRLHSQPQMSAHAPILQDRARLGTTPSPSRALTGASRSSRQPGYSTQAGADSRDRDSG
jgi:hypothetical protein